MESLTWAGFLGLVMGLIIHALKALMTAKIATGDASGLNPVTYFTKYWVEASLGFALAVGIWLSLPELVNALGDYTRIVGLTKASVGGYLPGFMSGMFGDQIADFLGGRIKKLYSDSGR